MRRLLPLAAILAGCLLAPASSSASFTHCPDDAPFSIAIYVKGMTCDTSLLVISHWVTAQHRACHTQPSCEFTYRSHDHRVSFHLKCSNSHIVDARNRHYIYMACFSDDRKHDIRSRYYWRGDYRPDR